MSAYMRAILKTALAGIVIGLVLAGAVRLGFNIQPQQISEMTMLVVYSDNTVKRARVHIDVCAAVAELALDGKIMTNGTEDAVEPYAMAMTCAPDALIRASFGRRHTP